MLLATVRKRSCSSGEPAKLELKFSNLRKVASNGERTRSSIASPEELKQNEAQKKLKHTMRSIFFFSLLFLVHLCSQKFQGRKKRERRTTLSN